MSPEERDAKEHEHLIWGWVIPRGGKKKPVILDRDNFDEISAITEEEIHGLGYFPLYSLPERKENSSFVPVPEKGTIVPPIDSDGWRNVMSRLCDAYAACNGEDHPAYNEARKLLRGNDHAPEPKQERLS